MPETREQYLARLHASRGNTAKHIEEGHARVANAIKSDALKHKAQAPKKLDTALPKHHSEAEAHANKTDPNWQMADRPHLTKGHQAYKDYLDKHK